MQHAQYNPANLQENLRILIEGQADFIDITTPSVSLQEMKIGHGLGRMPKGYSLVKGDLLSGATGSGGTKVLVSAEWNIIPGDIFNADTGHYSGQVDGTQYGFTYSATAGFVCPRAGSITAISLIANIGASGSNNGIITVQARKNGSSVFTCPTTAIAATGIKTAYATATPGAYTFAAGDIIGAYSALAFTSTQPTTTQLQSWIELSYSGSTSITEPIQAGATAWDSNNLFLKFVSTSTPITLAVW